MWGFLQKWIYKAYEDYRNFHEKEIYKYGILNKKKYYQPRDYENNGLDNHDKFTVKYCI